MFLDQFYLRNTWPTFICLYILSKAKKTQFQNITSHLPYLGSHYSLNHKDIALEFGLGILICGSLTYISGFWTFLQFWFCYHFPTKIIILTCLGQKQFCFQSSRLPFCRPWHFISFGIFGLHFSHNVVLVQPVKVWLIIVKLVYSDVTKNDMSQIFRRFFFSQKMSQLMWYKV